jgi:DNA-binding MarR family transcriptional regulator
MEKLMTEKTMPRLRFEGSVWCNLDIALRNIDQIFRTCVQDLGLSVIEWYVLRALFIEDGQHKLQDKGYIERLPDPNDRRAVRIYLTDKARAEEEAIMRLASTLDGQIDARLPEGSLNCFHEIITVLQTVELD